MKKVISGKVYDTDTAKAISRRIDRGSVSDVYYGQTLYRKRTGEYFIHREGYRGITDAIEPLSYDDARQWAKEYLDAGEYEAEFGVPDEGERASLNISISVVAAEKARRAASRKSTSLSGYIEYLIHNEDEKT